MDEYEEEYLSEGSEEEFGEVYDENDQEFLEHLMELRQQHARKLSQLEESYYNRQSDFGSGDLSNHGWEGSPSASTNSYSYTSRSSTGVDRAEVTIYGNQEIMFSPKSSTTWKPKVEEMYLELFTLQVTIPEPFTFDSRETYKHRVGSQKGPATANTFKARPVPTTTKMPLYGELQKAEERKKFKIKEREESTRAKLQQQKAIAKIKTEEPPTKVPEFKANPLPNEFLEPKFGNMLQQERQRKRRVIERAERLLKEAAMPPRMERHLSANKIDSVSPQKQEYTPTHGEFTFSPKVNSEVPDFARLQQEFEDLLEKKRKSFSVTRPVPFNMKTADVQNRKDKVIIDRQNDEARLREARWPWVSSRERPPPGELTLTLTQVPPHKTTVAAELKRKAAADKLERMKVEKKQIEEAQQKREEASKRVTQIIASRLPRKSTNWEREQRVQQQKEEQRQRDREYKQALEEKIRAMDENRVLLFERVSTAADHRRELQRIEDLLAKSGVSPDLARRKPRDVSHEAVKLAEVNYGEEDDQESDEYSEEFDEDEEEEEEEESEQEDEEEEEDED